jgi:arylsulfatase A-like enzyme
MPDDRRTATDGTGTGESIDRDRPNVLLLHAHDLGRHLGCYGHDVDSPNIDALAGESAQFTNYFCSAPQCGPSRSSIMTGTHPHCNGLMGHYWLGWGLNDDVTPMPQTFSDAGYETHVSGIHHLGPDPADAGYDVHHDGAASALEGDIVEDVRGVADAAGEGEEPFFFSAGFFEPHRTGPHTGHGFTRNGVDYPIPESVEPLPYLPDEEPIREDLREFHGAVGVLDEAVGEILDGLEDAGIADDTLVVFTTDHGIAFPRAKGMCYDPGVETALLVRHPDVDPGERDQFLSNVDLFPTLCDLTGVDGPTEQFAGRSFRPLLGAEGRSNSDGYRERDRIRIEITYHDKYNPIRGVRTERYKYLRNFGSLPAVYMPTDILHSDSGNAVFPECYGEERPEEELYDLAADPHEQENLLAGDGGEDALDSDAAAALADLRADVDDWMDRTDDVLLDGPVPVPEEHVERLKTVPW